MFSNCCQLVLAEIDGFGGGTRVNSTKDLFQQDLIERLFWFMRLRWLAAGGALLAVLLANAWGLVESLVPLVVISSALLGLNLLFYLHASKVRENPRWVTANARVQIICDLIILTLLIHFSGGIENPFMFYFIFHLFHSSIQAICVLKFL